MITLITLIIMGKIKKRLKSPNWINIMEKRRSLNYGFFSLLYGFGTIKLILKEENKLSILPI